MTGPEHYLTAQRWLFKATNHTARGDEETIQSCTAIAQVHATLALAAATATSVVLQLPISSDIAKSWAQAIELPGGAA